jgi:hypothetical protein
MDLYGGNMAQNKYAVIMRILDDQNRLTDRADTKAISLLTTLGLFTVLFLAQLNSITNLAQINPFVILLLIVYVVAVVLAVLHIIMAISPRLRTTRHPIGTEKTAQVPQPTFFGGICQFPDAVAYNKCLDDLAASEEAVNTTYVRQVYEIAKINKIKYKFVGRAVWFVVTSLISQIIFIVLLYSQKLLFLQGQ